MVHSQTECHANQPGRQQEKLSDLDTHVYYLSFNSTQSKSKLHTVMPGLHTEFNPL